MLRIESLPRFDDWSTSQRETPARHAREDETNATASLLLENLHSICQAFFFLPLTAKSLRAAASIFPASALASDVPFFCWGYSHSQEG